MKKLLFIIFILTVFDAVCTAAGMLCGAVQEANPVMVQFMAWHPGAASALVCAAVGGILLGLYRVRSRIKWLFSAMTAVLIAKIGIAVIHVMWISQVI
ncbi:DUF5658 family protein [Papillibacter cinnamivorans]|uniref:DUF5658 domain-containing protein n=1 Tax=Papillibacter cinnamivorans DSM 12816 TaxID=1122930 RepID=A0A1W1YU07_9FIRM|nr:DUF5658 family protein [Papillibacter cinnamivorans]SMC39582.1 hypothetical protein SAMN02745168_0650 [Papillibacter cinnamivorans DSM 12816]